MKATYKGSQTKTVVSATINRRRYEQEFEYNSPTEVSCEPLVEVLYANPSFEVEPSSPTDEVEDATSTFVPSAELKLRAKAVGVRLKADDTEASYLARIEEKENGQDA